MPREKAVRTIGNGKAPTAKSLGSEADGPLGLTGETFVAKPAKKKSIGGDLGFEATLGRPQINFAAPWTRPSTSTPSWVSSS